MRELQQVRLDHRGVAYIRGCLEWTALGRALTEVIDHAKGECFTLVPPEVNSERLHDFKSGGLLKENLDFSRAVDLGAGHGAIMAVESLFDEEFARVRARLAADGGLSCIIANPMQRKGDSDSEKYAARFYVGDEVYHLVTAETSEEVADLALSACPPWMALKAVTAAAPHIDSELEASLAELQRCAAAVQEIVCGAYDGEGFVHWRREM